MSIPTLQFLLILFSVACKFSSTFLYTFQELLWHMFFPCFQIHHSYLFSNQSTNQHWGARLADPHTVPHWNTLLRRADKILLFYHSIYLIVFNSGLALFLLNSKSKWKVACPRWEDTGRWATSHLQRPTPVITPPFYSFLFHLLLCSDMIRVVICNLQLWSQSLGWWARESLYNSTEWGIRVKTKSLLSNVTSNSKPELHSYPDCPHHQ